MCRPHARDGRRSALQASILTASLVLASAPGLAGVRLEVGGSARRDGTALEVRVDLINSGDAPTGPVTVQGELLGARDEARLGDGLLPGATQSLVLRFPAEVPRPGVHPLALTLEYAVSGAAGGEAVASQRACLLLALGETAEPAVRLSVAEARIQTFGALEVGLESADGAPHRARLRVLTPRGLRAQDPAEEVPVPATGQASALVDIVRVGAPRDSVHGVIVVAGVGDGPVERTSMATGLVRVLPDPAWLPRLRRPLLAAALILLLAAAVVEVRRQRAGSRQDAAGPGGEP